MYVTPITSRMYSCSTNYEGRSINQLQNSVIFQFSKCEKFEIGKFCVQTYFITTASLLSHHLYLYTVSQCSIWLISFLLSQLPSVKGHCKLWEKWTSSTSELFKRQTSMFQCFMYHPIHLSIYPKFLKARWIKRLWLQPGRSLSATFSRLWANVLHQKCIAGLVKHMSPYTGCISEWMALALSPFAHRKQLTECWALRDAFTN